MAPGVEAAARDPQNARHRGDGKAGAGLAVLTSKTSRTSRASREPGVRGLGRRRGHGPPHPLKGCRAPPGSLAVLATKASRLLALGLGQRLERRGLRPVSGPRAGRPHPATDGPGARLDPVRRRRNAPPRAAQRHDPGADHRRAGRSRSGHLRTLLRPSRNGRRTGGTPVGTIRPGGRRRSRASCSATRAEAPPTTPSAGPAAGRRTPSRRRWRGTDHPSTCPEDLRRLLTAPPPGHGAMPHGRDPASVPARAPRRRSDRPGAGRRRHSAGRGSLGRARRSSPSTARWAPSRGSPIAPTRRMASEAARSARRVRRDRFVRGPRTPPGAHRIAGRRVKARLP